MRSSIYVLTLLLTLQLLAVPADAQLLAPTLNNLDFEDGTAGEIPLGWEVPTKVTELGFHAETVDDTAAEGKQSARIFLQAEEPPLRGFANLMRSFDATAFRGKRVRFSAQVKTAPKGYKGRSQMWMRADLEPQAMGFFDNMGDRPITSEEWQRYEIVGDIENNAAQLNIGIMQFGEGETWFDDVQIEIVGEAGEGASPPAQLSDQGLENLVAFARLFGHVRYFHPSDQVLQANWLRTAMGGVSSLEGMESPEELAAGLEEFFRPLAPTLRVGHGDMGSADLEFEIPQELMPPSLDEKDAPQPERTGFWHFGIELNTKSAYKSRRAESGNPPDIGGMTQSVDIAAYRGRKVRLSMWIRAASDAGDVHLFAIPFSQGFDPTFAVLADDHEALPIDGTWQQFHVVAEIDEEAESMAFGLVYQPNEDGDSILVDHVTLTALNDEGTTDEGTTEGSTEKEISIFGGDFEHGPSDKPDGWNVEGDSVLKGFYAELQSEDAHHGQRAARLRWRSPARDIAQPDQPRHLDLGRGIVAQVPIALWRDPEGTFPKTEEPPPSNGKPAGFRPTPSDRTSRLAWVITTWNTLQHFYPYFDVVPTDWPAALREALQAAAVDENSVQYQETLKRLLRELHDGHGGVYGLFPFDHRVPVLWSWIEDQLVVTKVDTSAQGLLQPGDVVLRIDGASAAAALEGIEREISGATPQWRRFRSAGLLGIGNRGYEFELLVRTGDEVPRTVRISATSPIRGEQTLQEERPEKITEIRPGIFYVDLDRVTTAEFDAEVEKLAAADGIVFDLRGYPRNISTTVLAHLIDEPITSTRWEIPIITRPDREGMRFHSANWAVLPKQPRLTGKVAFLTDGRAISYAETYLSMVAHYELAEIVGGATAGTNGNINPFALDNANLRIIWTGMRVRKHDGTRHHGIGVLPTVPVQRTIAGARDGRDEILEKALEIVAPDQGDAADQEPEK